MSEMIERVKSAIAEKMAPAIDARAPYAKVMFDMAARAAIAEMREPTEKMDEAGNDVGPDQSPIDYYQAMIDAALSPESRG